MRLKAFWFSLLGIFLCTVAAAAQYPPAINAMMQKGVTVVKQFDAPANLTGYVIKANNQYVIVYATADGKHVLIGNLLDENTHNLTQQEKAKYIPKPDLGKAWKKLQNAHWIAEGAKDPKTVVYEFTDPNCPYCHLFWLANQPYLKAGLQVRHIVVGFLTPSSKMKAAAILGAENPQAAHRKNEKNYRTDVAENKAGGIEAADNPGKDVLAKVAANTRLMSSLQVNGTPGIFYKDKQGKVHRIVGLPKLSRLPNIYQLPKQPITNPQLKRYQ